MKKKTSTLFLATLIALTLATASIPFTFSSEYVVYDPGSNVCVVHPTGGDDTPNLREAFEKVVAGGFGGEVELVEGVYTITEEIVVVGFDGWFHGAGKDKTTVENAYTETWPHRDVEHFPEVASLFLFYQTDNLTRTLKFSDMTIKVHGKTYDYDGFTGINCIDVVAYVNGDKEDFYNSEINTVLERMHFEGEELDTWHAYNVINTYQVGGEFVLTDTWYFKPISGVQTVTDCTLYNVGGALKFNSNNGNVTVRNNIIENVVFGITQWDPGDYANKGVSWISDNKISGGILDLVWLTNSENTVIERNTISGSMFGTGISCYGSDYNYIQDNEITGCGGYGIYLEESTQNVVFKNSLAENAVDLGSDGQGVNFWINNDHTSAQNVTLVDSIEEEFDSLEMQLKQADEDKSSLESDLQSANAMLSSLESEQEDTNAELSELEEDLEEASAEVSDLESQLSSTQSEIDGLESRVASSLTYTTSIAIAVILAIIAGAAGFLAAKRTLFSFPFFIITLTRRVVQIPNTVSIRN